jgi:hypothetical protein
MGFLFKCRVIWEFSNNNPSELSSNDKKFKCEEYSSMGSLAIMLSARPGGKYGKENSSLCEATGKSRRG